MTFSVIAFGSICSQNSQRRSPSRSKTRTTFRVTTWSRSPTPRWLRQSLSSGCSAKKSSWQVNNMDAAVANTTGLEVALAAPAPFVGLRRGYYGAIAVDPASHFKSYTAIQSQNPSSRRDNERHYKTMSFVELVALPIKELAAPTGCHLFVWTSGPFLPQALKLIEAWGFKYSTRAFTWLKTRRGWER